MNRSRYRRLKSLFNAALDQPADERDGYLARACAGDVELLQEVRELVARVSDIESAVRSGRKAAEIVREACSN